MTIKRLLTALILLPIVTLIILKGGTLLFACLLGIFSFIGIHEFFCMAIPNRTLETWLAATAGTVLVFIPLLDNERILTGTMAALFMIFALLILFRIKNIADAARDMAFTMLAFLYIPFLLMHLVMLRQTSHGTQWLFVVMLVVMTNDSAAYYTGSAFGRHKLYPLVSPNKSIEGALGGVVGSICGTMLAKFTFFSQLSLVDALFTAIFIGILGQTGDLFESLLKRSFGVKDTGTIFPGHGGMLDRLDSILFAGPAMYYYATYFFKG